MSAQQRTPSAGAVLVVGHHQEVLVGLPPGRFVVGGQIGQEQLRRVLASRTPRPVDHAVDIYADALHGGDVVDALVEAPRFAQAGHQAHVVVVAHHLVARQRTKVVAVGELKGLLDGILTRFRTHVQEYRHPLLGAGAGVVEGEVVVELRVFLVLGLPDAKRKRVAAVPAVPPVTQILLRLAGPVEAVRGRKGRHRSARQFGGDQAIAI